MRPVKRRDPAPSRAAFRLKRLWRSARVRRAVTLHLPLAAGIAALGWAAAQPDIRNGALATVETWRAEIASRPEFAVRRIEVLGAGEEVAREVLAALEPWRGASSLSADAAAIRDSVEALGWVASANVRLEAPETLIVSVVERRPAAIWRSGGALTLLDATGAVIAPLAARADRPDLPVFAGLGADRAAAEGLAVIAAAGPLVERLRGLERIGERRWNAVFANGPVVLLPAEGGVDAMGYLAALDRGEGVLSRDVDRIDLRLRERPTLRLNPDAATSLEASRKPKRPGEDA